MKIYTPGEHLSSGSDFDTCLHNADYINHVVHDNGLQVIAGLDQNNNVVSYDLCKAPHTMIAGCTGSGKSVLLHCIINSLLRCYSVDRFQLLMVDPKKVQLSMYSKLKYHLKQPIITDTGKALQALQNAVKEMQHRYKVMMKKGLRCYDTSMGKRLVIIIDEYAQLIMSDKRIQLPLTRLAQLGRACGIHLIISTQRPDSKVFSGLLKANIPTVFALKVRSAIDSRVVIDQNGAQLLNGKGDCLLKTDTSITRLQVPYITDTDIDSVVKWYTSKACRKG